MEKTKHALPLIGAQVTLEQGLSLEKTEQLFIQMKDCGMKACLVDINGFLFPQVQSDRVSILENAVRIASDNDISVYFRLELLSEGPGVAEDFNKLIDALNNKAAIKGCIISVSEGQTDVSDICGIRDKYSELLHSTANAINKPGQEFEIILDCGNILETAFRYDFSVLRNDFSAFGFSAVPVKDYSAYSRRRYNLALSAASKIMRSAAGDKPFWVSGLQAGNNGGEDGFSPSREEITQWLWTAAGNGAAGVLFDKLNLPAQGRKAGGVALLNLLGKASEKATAIKECLAAINENAELFSLAEPMDSPVTVLYTNQSIASESYSMYSAVAAYDILVERGVPANICEIDEYDWKLDEYRGRAILISGQETVHSRYYEAIRNYVKKGGKLIVEGRSFYFDENVWSNFSKEKFPLSDVFGGRAEEFSALMDNEKLPVGNTRLWVNKWYGLLRNEASGEILPIIRNKYGRGRVTWIPSMIFLGAINTGHRRKLSMLLLDELEAVTQDIPMKFNLRRSGITVNYLKSGEGYITIISNKGQHRRRVSFDTENKVERLLFSDIRYDRKAKAKNRKIKLRSQHTAAVLWKS